MAFFHQAKISMVGLQLIREVAERESTLKELKKNYLFQFKYWQFNIIQEVCQNEHFLRWIKKWTLILKQNHYTQCFYLLLFKKLSTKKPEG